MIKIDLENKEGKQGISYNKFLKYSFYFVLFILGIIIVFRILALFVAIDLTLFWPLGVFSLVYPGIIEVLITIAIFFSFLLFIIFYFKKKLKIIYIIFISLILIISANLIHGIFIGLENPINGLLSSTKQFYDDAINIINPFKFITEFEKLQPYLGTHAKTHPPGATLLFYLLYKIFYYPALISLVICSFSTIFSGFFFYKFLKSKISEEISRYIIVIFFLIPAIQIYYLANLYAIVTTLFLGVLYFYFHPNIKISIIGSVICVFFAASITFMFVFIIALLFSYEIIKNRYFKSLKKIFLIVVILLILFIAVLLISGFNYVNSFLIASKLENPGGFMFISNPIEYIFTRIEDILEIIIFFGPFLSVLLILGIKDSKKNNYEFYLLTTLGLLVMLILFLIGAYKTGETARGCLFLYPFLLIPIAFYLDKYQFTQIEKKILFILVFGQSLFMELLGFYFW